MTCPRPHGETWDSDQFVRRSILCLSTLGLSELLQDFFFFLIERNETRRHYSLLTRVTIGSALVMFSCFCYYNCVTTTCRKHDTQFSPVLATALRDRSCYSPQFTDGKAEAQAGVALPSPSLQAALPLVNTVPSAHLFHVFVVQMFQNVPMCYLLSAGGVQVGSGGGVLSGETEARGRTWAFPAGAAGFVSLPRSAAFLFFRPLIRAQSPPCPRSALPTRVSPAPPPAPRAEEDSDGFGPAFIFIPGPRIPAALPPSPRLLQTDDKRECL